ncbi:hypothetical protein [Streptomyces sp. NBC_01089]|uniref:hypothetical protein n=1 Tax=Streptomyces sp. NBC_01089 TaxID=2903747 RepID=UPI00386E7883|nr:hypothetical protein OG510_33900 [Streptomyces sp. NBC_01089]
MRSISWRRSPTRRSVVVLGENEIAGRLPGVRGLLAAETNFWWWRTGADNGVRLNRPDHPAWDHLTERAVCWHYHGLLEPPEGATALVHTVMEHHGAPERRQVLLDETWPPPPAG